MEKFQINYVANREPVT